MIPKTIHQIWIGDQDKRPKILMDTWKGNHPNWDYKLWTEKEIEELELLNLNKFEIHPMLSGKADIARYEILFKFGGFFIDADSISIKPLDDLLKDKIVTVYESERFRNGLLANGYIGCEPGSRFMFEMMNHVRKVDDKKILSLHAWQTTGPLPFTKIAKKHSIVGMKSKSFIPIHFEDENFISKNISKISLEDIYKIKHTHPNSYSYQFWGSKSDY